MGYVEGKNLAVEYRWAENRYDRLPALAAELVDDKVDAIAATGGDLPSAAAKKATTTIPIVFTSTGDPVEAGLIANLNRPGGNLTGVSFLIVELMPKRLELLSELVPPATVTALLVNPRNPQTEGVISEVQKAARGKGVPLQIVKAGTESEIDTAFATLIQSHAGALIIAGDPFFFTRINQLAMLAFRHAIPAI
jgi:putative ABC transport system substrate-binding protein